MITLLIYFIIIAIYLAFNFFGVKQIIADRMSSDATIRAVYIYFTVIVFIIVFSLFLMLLNQKII